MNETLSPEARRIMARAAAGRPITEAAPPMMRPGGIAYRDRREEMEEARRLRDERLERARVMRDERLAKARAMAEAQREQWEERVRLARQHRRRG